MKHSSLRKSHNRNKSMACMETLEPRLMMSGDVAAGVLDGSLKIYGDAADNQIVIDQDGLEDGQYRITGQEGTTINGQDEIIIDGVTRNIIANMKGGDDQLTFDNVEAIGDIIVKGRAGNDTLSVNGGSIGGNLKFHGGRGDNSATIDGVEIGGKLVATGHDGTDNLNVKDSTVEKKILFKPRRNENELTISGSEVGEISLVGRRGDIKFDISDSTVNSIMRINWGFGEADIDISCSLFKDDVRIGTGRYSDDVKVENTKFEMNTYIITGWHDDNVTFEDSATTSTLWETISTMDKSDGLLLIKAGRGKDEVLLEEQEAYQIANMRLYGGREHDEISIDLMEESADGLIFRGFETSPFL